MKEQKLHEYHNLKLIIVSVNKQDLFIQEKMKNYPEFMQVYAFPPNREVQYFCESMPHIISFDRVMSQNHARLL